MIPSGQNIFLIGLPGSGKTTAGKLLAEVLRYPFLDTDKRIESEEGKTIKEIFNNHGEIYFRKLESDLLKKLDTNGRVVATGGGMPCYEHNLELMKNKGLVVYLKGSPEKMAARLSMDEPSKRPLIESGSVLKTISKLKRLLKKRSPFYESADFIVDCQQSPPEIVNDIRICLRQK